MRRFLLALAFVSLPSLVFAQTTDPALFSSIDSPQSGQWVSGSAPITLSGWAFQSQFLQQPEAVSVCYIAYLPWGIDHSCLAPTVEWRQARPDVSAAYASWFGPMSAYMGYRLTLPAGSIPTNAFVAFYVTWSGRLGVKQDLVAVTVTP